MGRAKTCNQLPELSGKKMDATNALLEPPLKHAKMIILPVKIRLFSLEGQFFLSLVYTRILPLKLRRYSAGIESDSQVDFETAKMRLLHAICCQLFLNFFFGN